MLRVCVRFLQTYCTASFQTKKNGIFLHMFIFGIYIYTLELFSLMQKCEVINHFSPIPNCIHNTQL